MNIMLVDEGNYKSELRFYPGAGRECAICGEGIEEEEFVAIIVRIGRTSASLLGIHKHHFSEEALDMMNEKKAEVMAKALGTERRRDY